ncbi:MAG: hypothetical protein M3O71_13580 [Bacteroidota bacterium]|nr:hypothetical protein [Bacteroidota bacterium]
MKKEIPNINLIDASVALATLTALLYLSNVFFQIGINCYFKIPNDFLEVNSNSILISIEVLFVPIFLILASSLCSFLLLIQGNQKTARAVIWITILTVLDSFTFVWLMRTTNLHPEFIVLINGLFKGVIATVINLKIIAKDSLQIRLWENFLLNRPMLFLALLLNASLISTVSKELGIRHARLQSLYLVEKNHPEHVFIRKNGDLIIEKTIDIKTNTLQDTILLKKANDHDPLIFISKTGRLKLKSPSDLPGFFNLSD